MQRKLNFLALLIALLGVFNLAQAAPNLVGDIADDTFDYPTGELNTQNGGTGWGGAWTANTGVTELLDSTAIPMSYSVPSGGNVVDGERILRVSGNNDAAIQRALSASQTGTVYISFLLRLNGAINNNDFVAIWFNTNQGPNIGIKGNRATNTDAEPDIFVRPFNNATPPLGAYAPTNLVVGQTYFVVGRLSKDGANYDRYQLWVNPAFGDSATPQAELTGTGTGTTANFTLVGLRSVNLDAGDSIDISGIHIGTTWDDVVPGPGDVLAVELQDVETTAATPLWLIAFAAALALFTVGRLAKR
ncbi:MAG: hypothetical protein OT477_05310 [Chloroflexi bacterium]|nr:hypothetical protein [Chloroflexota bacterium]